MLRLSALAMSALLLASPTAAYEIRTRVRLAGVEVFLTLDVHESITALSESCLAAGLAAPRPSRPAHCWNDANILAVMSTSEEGERYSRLQLASRWPDDPTRQSSLHTFPKLGFNLAFGCRREVAENNSLEGAGLLCTSHFGRGQFMHAMASVGDTSAKDTYQRIMAWARFAFRVARGDQILTENYCSAMDRQPDPLRSALQMNDRSFCSVRRGFFRTYQPWTVRTFFTLSCRNPFSSARCDEPPEGVEGDQQARDAAAGALLHLVQDSFSQAHAARSVTTALPAGGPFEPRVVCSYPTAYYDYGAQTKEVHGPSDKPPARDGSCDDDPRTATPNDPQTDDVVTASAMVLWFLRQEGSQEEAFLQYLTDRVFGPTPDS